MKESESSLLQHLVTFWKKIRASPLALALLSGGVTFLVFLLTLAVRFNRVNFSTIVFIGIGLIFMCFFAFILSSAIRVQVSIRQNCKQLQEQILTKVHQIEVALNDLTGLVEKFDKIPIEQWHLISQRGTKFLNSAKNIGKLLKDRMDEVRELSNNGELISLTEASQLLDSSIEFGDDQVEAIVNEEKIPALEPEEWEPTIRLFCKELETEFRAFHPRS